MTKFVVSLDRTYTITVDAKNREEARNKAMIIFPDKEITNVKDISDNSN
jgi:hypothetical protein